MRLPVFESKILNGREDTETIRSFFPNKTLKLSLLYRGSEHGKTNSVFHQRCDNKGPLLILVKTEHDKVCGGFITQKWKIPAAGNYEFCGDNDAFVFSVTNKTTHKQYSNLNMAVRFCSDNFLFGIGVDLIVSENYDQNNQSYSNFGYTYLTPNSWKAGSNEASAYLGGSRNFKVKDVEVHLMDLQ